MPGMDVARRKRREEEKEEEEGVRIVKQHPTGCYPADD